MGVNYIRILIKKIIRIDDSWFLFCYKVNFENL